MIFANIFFQNDEGKYCLFLYNYGFVCGKTESFTTILL